MEHEMDAYGDSYTEPATASSLAAAMALVAKEQAGGKLRPPELRELELQQRLDALEEADALALTTKYNCLRRCVIYAPPEALATRLRARLYGARLADAPDASVTHALLPANADKEAVDELRKQLRTARLDATDWYDVHVLSQDWLLACAREETRASVETYQFTL